MYPNIHPMIVQFELVECTKHVIEKCLFNPIIVRFEHLDVDILLECLQTFNHNIVRLILSRCCESRRYSFNPTIVRFKPLDPISNLPYNPNYLEPTSNHVFALYMHTK